jgi:hypothetical protein
MLDVGTPVKRAAAASVCSLHSTAAMPPVFAMSKQLLFVLLLLLLAAPAEEEKEEEGCLSAADCSAVMFFKHIYSSTLFQQPGVGHMAATGRSKCCIARGAWCSTGYACCVALLFGGVMVVSVNTGCVDRHAAAVHLCTTFVHMCAGCVSGCVLS